MDVANLLSDAKLPPHHTRRTQQPSSEPQLVYNQGILEPNNNTVYKNIGAVNRPAQVMTAQYSSASPQRGSPARYVTFELLLTEGTQNRARLPLRVGIYPHDSTESIISTVKNFFGLYDGFGVSFENKHGDVLIPLYQNFEDKMMIYVRVVEDMVSPDGTPRNSMSPRRARLGPPIEMGPPFGGQSISRPSSRAAARRSVSPQNSNGRRSQSNKARSRGSIKSRAGSTHGSLADPNGEFNGYETDSDGGDASVTSSRRENIIANADISVDNIVEGGRRKRARFEASELPLFVPTQIPVTTSVSSISPQRRLEGHTGASPYQFSNQQTFAYNQPLPSPQSHTQSDFSHMGQAYGYPSTGNFHANRMGHRGSISYAPPRYPTNGMHHGIPPTPDPTINSVISDEDVALQLMRLGDASNFSSHARVSTGTMDETLSGRAELGSSAEASDEGSDDDGPAGAVYSGDSAEEYEDQRDESFNGSDGLDAGDAARPAKKAKVSMEGKHISAVPKSIKMPKQRTSSHGKVKVKTDGAFKLPMSPTSIPGPQRKGSGASSLNVQHTQFAADEEDLSSKPRCQRCRKSKKGCDRQRPCGRCKDAGIGIEGCISEDEGNGRKGRYGRHMGVAIKKEGGEMSPPQQVALPVPGSMAAPGFIPDKNGKKRKRS